MTDRNRNTANVAGKSSKLKKTLSQLALDMTAYCEQIEQLIKDLDESKRLLLEECQKSKGLAKELDVLTIEIARVREANILLLK